MAIFPVLNSSKSFPTVPHPPKTQAVSIEIISMTHLISNFFSISKQVTKLIVNEINQIKNEFSNSHATGLSFNTRVYLKGKELRSVFSNNVSTRLIKNKLKGFSFSAINLIYISSIQSSINN
mgnify:CR=1 FL=1